MLDFGSARFALDVRRCFAYTPRGVCVRHGWGQEIYAIANTSVETHAMALHELAYEASWSSAVPGAVGCNALCRANALGAYTLTVWAMAGNSIWAVLALR